MGHPMRIELTCVGLLKGVVDSYKNLIVWWITVLLGYTKSLIEYCVLF